MADDEVYPRPEGLDEWNDEHFVAFSDNLSRHIVYIVQQVGRPLHEVFWLWWQTLDSLIQDEPGGFPDFVIGEWLWYARQVQERKGG